jgi:hypothetical protein
MNDPSLPQAVLERLDVHVGRRYQPCRHFHSYSHNHSATAEILDSAKRTGEIGVDSDEQRLIAVARRSVIDKVRDEQCIDAFFPVIPIPGGYSVAEHDPHTSVEFRIVNTSSAAVVWLRRIEVDPHYLGLWAKPHRTESPKPMRLQTPLVGVEPMERFVPSMKAISLRVRAGGWLSIVTEF